jgi:hypothetical protein
MARGILHGHFHAFYWGQHYGGGEPFVVALLFALFGQSFFVLGLAPVLLNAIAAVLVFYLGRRLFGVGVGVGAALVSWIWPEVLLWQSTMEYGFRAATLVCGLALCVVALRLIDSKQHGSISEGNASRGIWRFRDPALFGLLLGLGWWCSPEIAYFAVPVALVMILKLLTRKIQLNSLEAAVLGASAGVGALPWLWSNLRSGFASLQAGHQPHPGFVEHLHMFFAHAFPIAAGAQLIGDGTWLGGPLLGPLVELGVGASIVFALAWYVFERRAGLLVLYCLTFPLLYALSPFTWYWHDGRYVEYLPPVMAIVIVAGVSQLIGGKWAPRFMRGRRHVSAAALVITVALATTLCAAAYKSPFNPDHVAGSPEQRWTTFSFDPNHVEVQLSNDLRHIGVHDVIVGYWLAYPLIVASGSTITASDIVFVRSAGLLAQVERSASPAWLFADQHLAAFKGLVATTRTGLDDPGCAVSTRRCLTAPMFRTLLRRQSISYRSVVLTRDGIEVVIPSRKIDVALVLAHLEKIDISHTRPPKPALA